MHLLLVEDDQDLADSLKPILNRQGYAVERSIDGEDALFRGLHEHFDIIILDLGLPKINGLDVLRQWRLQDLQTPILILTGRDSWRDRVDGLQAGADDYLGKPFHSEELLARLQALSRRHYQQVQNVIQVDELRLDTNQQQLNIDGGLSVKLTQIEYRILRQFMQHPNTVLSKTQLSESAYEEDDLRDSNVIEVYIKRLRNLVGQQRIETRRGQGYLLRARHG